MHQIYPNPPTGQDSEEDAQSENTQPDKPSGSFRNGNVVVPRSDRPDPTRGPIKACQGGAPNYQQH
jgi:hypothetical protein